jgi:hypothetical protein
MHPRTPVGALRSTSRADHALAQFFTLGRRSGPDSPPTSGAGGAVIRNSKGHSSMSCRHYAPMRVPESFHQHRSSDRHRRGHLTDARNGHIGDAMKQQSFHFDAAPRGHPRNEPPRPPQPPPHGSSICHYCGERIPSSLMDSTPSVADDQRWAMITPYHN